MIFLERLETFEGLCFATTNYTGGMDAAIERRWNFKVRLYENLEDSKY
jgi:hypothetical protein